MANKTKNHSHQNKGRNSASRVKRDQPRKDNSTKRVNFDNTRRSRFDKDMEEYEAKMHAKKTSGSNDVSWYAKSSELLKAAASIPFSQTTGTMVPFTPANSSMSSVPGVMAMYWLPQIGGAFDAPINQAANSTYSYVVHANSRNKSYDAPDLMQIILCGSSLFSMLALGIRAYGVMRTFDQRNLYLPKYLVNAMGFDYEDLKANLANMWFDLNELIARSKQIWIPNNFPFTARWFWMNSNIYMDAESIKAQYYMFVPYGYYVYNETGDFADNDHLANATVNYWFNAGANPITFNKWSDYLTKMNTMFNALLDSQDRGIIFGDILKAYGEGNIYALPDITSDYTVQPVYDKEVLTQIENLTVFPYTYESIDQDKSTGRLYTSAYTPASSQLAVWPVAGGVINTLPPALQVLNFHQLDEPTPEQIMVATRLKAFGVAGLFNNKPLSLYPNGVNYTGLTPVTCGTETIHGVYMWHAVYDESTVGTVTATYLNTNGVNTSSLPLAALYNWNCFDWAPWLYNTSWTTPWTGINDVVSKANFNAKGQPTISIAMGDYDYYTYIDAETAKKLNTTAIYSEFDVPIM